MDNDFHTFRGYQLRSQTHQPLTPSMEDYLEMIYRNCLNEGHARISHLAGQLNVRASSTTKIVQKLAELGFLQYRPYGIVQLTKQGTRAGSFLLHRHKVLQEFLQNLGLTDTLLQDTEMLEHHISLPLLESLEAFLLFLKEQPDFLEDFTAFRQSLTKPETASGETKIPGT